MNMTKFLIWLVLSTSIFLYSSIYKVKTDEQVILTRFGAIQKGPIVEPGYHFKFFTLDTVRRYPTSNLTVEFTSPSCTPPLPVTGGTLEMVIEDPIEFLKKAGSVSQVDALIASILRHHLCGENAAPNRTVDIPAITDLMRSQLSIAGISVVEIGYGSLKADATH